MRLTADELLKYGEELATIIQDIGDEESRQTRQKATMKARLAELDSRRTQVANKVRRREEYRDVKVLVYYDHSRGIVQETCEDTGEIVTTRQMTDAERQIALPIETRPETPMPKSDGRATPSAPLEPSEPQAH